MIRPGRRRYPRATTKPPQGRGTREHPDPKHTPVPKEHPQYGTRIPPEELEAMRELRRTQERERTGRDDRRRHHGGHVSGPRGPRPQKPMAGEHRPRPGSPSPGHYYAAPDRPRRHRREDRHRRGGPRPDRVGYARAGEGPPRPAPAPEVHPLGRLREYLFGYQTAAALLASYKLGLFAEIHRRPQASVDIARHLGADLRGVQALLEALVAMGVIHRHGATYVLPREFAPYLVADSDGHATGMIEFTSDLYLAWSDLGRAVREGLPQHRLSSEALLDGDPERVRRYIRSVHTSSRSAAVRVVEMAPLPEGSALLDVGAGSGIFAAEYARRTAGLRAQLFDLPPTLDIAREILRGEGLEDLVEYVPGDYRRDDFPGPVDTVLVSNVFQTESEENCFHILRKAYGALRLGGTLLLHGVMPEGDAPPSAPEAMFGLLMYLVFDHGGLQSVTQVSEWLAQERFGVRAIRPLGPPFHSKLIVASRLG